MSMLQMAILSGNSAVNYVDEIIGNQPEWVREDNAASYNLNTPNRVVRQNYPPRDGNLASPAAKRHVLGLVGGNEVSQLGGNPQDIESELFGLTRPLTGCPSREYKPTMEGQETIVVNNRKTNLAVDIRPIHLPEVQMWAYPVTYAPLPLRKQTCGSPQKY